MNGQTNNSELGELKKDTHRWLELLYKNKLDNYRYALDGTDKRLLLYVETNVERPEIHNLYELLSLKMFFERLDKYSWSAKRVKHFFRLYESLRFSGINGRRQYKLTPVQAFQFANIYGLTRDDGRRLIREVLIMVARKYAKTTAAAGMSVYDLLFGDFNAQAYVGANSYDQAKICFDEIRNIMNDIDPYQKHIRINRESISFKDKTRDSSASCLSANAKTKDGLNASLVIMDEYAQARDTKTKNGADLKNTLTSSMGARREPLTVTITTASEVIDGPFARELEGIKKVMRGELENDSLFASMFLPDEGDREDDPLTWHKVQPHIGITVNEDFYREEWKKAQLSPDNMMVFRTKLLNIMTVKQVQRWISADEIRNLKSASRAKEGSYTMVAFDLSVWDDFSCVAYETYDADANMFRFECEYYIPEESVEKHARRELYRKWNREGWLTFQPGNVVNYEAIAQDIIAKNGDKYIIGIGYDPYHSKEAVNLLSASGAANVMQPVKQTYGAFTSAVEALEMLVKQGKCSFDGNPITEWCFGNCVIDEDKIGNRKPIKMRQDAKIDGAVCCLMTTRLFMDFKR